MANIESPIPLSEIESVLAWVDTFKLSRPTRKINRDFSDAVMLAEILSVHYPKLVEMHNYPPRNSHSLKLNNWMTLNRKVLKKLKLNLCCNTMEQLANCAPGVIERVLVMVKDKIRRDEDAQNSLRETEQNVSSGGSYYEACGDEEHVLVVPVKTRVNGILETIQQKVVSYDVHCALKEELKDAKDAADVLKQKVEHLDNLLKLKEERIDELQNQLERKQSRRKEAEITQSNAFIPTEVLLMPEDLPIKLPVASLSLKALDSKVRVEESRIPISKTLSRPSISEVSSKDVCALRTIVNSKPDLTEKDNIKPIPETPMAEKPFLDLPDAPHISVTKLPDIQGSLPVIALNKPILDAPNKSTTEIPHVEQSLIEIPDAIHNSMPEIPIVQHKSDGYIDVEEFKDSEELTVTIGDTIQNELNNINKPVDMQDFSYVA